jgi:hypothetical protein
MRTAPRLLLLCVACLGFSFSVANAATWRRTLTIQRTGPALANIPVPVTLTPGNFDYGHVDPSGILIRFTDSDQTTPLPCYHESWNTGGTSVIWVNVPSIPANSTKTLYLYHSTVPGEIIPTSSNFSSTFPNAYRLMSGSAILTGSLTYDWFEIAAGATVDLVPQSPLVVSARRAIVSGTINARGMGNVLGGLGQGQSDSWGGAGGGYGGAGGAGPASTAGATHGTQTQSDLAMGSSGGTTVEPNLQGFGGGLVTIQAQRLDVTGTIDVRGANGWDPIGGPGNPGGGGGSGGGSLLLAYDLRVSGTILADGGHGASFGGGGGGGGRIKLLHESTSSGTPITSVSGGLGGSYAQPGAAGTVHSGTALLAGADFDQVVASVGPEVGLLAVEPGALTEARLGPPRPNPSLRGVTLRLELDRASRTRAVILDLQGRQVRTLLDERVMPVGAHELAWDLLDESGRKVPASVYLADITVDQERITRRLVVMP